MISVWRIDKANRAKEESFSGKGASLEGGRWNKPGSPVVYTAEALSLAALEKFVHMGDEGRSVDLVFYEVKIPDGVRVEELSRRSLPPDWKAVPAPRSTQDIGTRWVRAAQSSILKVPSIIAETEHNYLINPLHPDFKNLRISSAKPYRFDERLWQPKKKSHEH